METSIVLLVLLMASFAFVAFKFYQRAKSLSLTSASGTLKYAKWARSNKKEARWILLVFNIAMMVCGLCIGLACHRSGLSLGKPMIYVGIGMFLIGTFLFPDKDKADPNIATRYRKKKILSVLRIAGSSLAIMAYVNSYLMTENGEMVQEASVDVVILIVLATAGLLIFGYAILALSCGIACSGYEGLAIVVLVGGISGLIVLYVWTIRRILNMKKKQKPKQQLSDETLDDEIV